MPSGVSSFSDRKHAEHEFMNKFNNAKNKSKQGNSKNDKKICKTSELYGQIEGTDGCTPKFAKIRIIKIDDNNEITDSQNICEARMRPKRNLKLYKGTYVLLEKDGDCYDIVGTINNKHPEFSSLQKHSTVNTNGITFADEENVKENKIEYIETEEQQIEEQNEEEQSDEEFEVDEL